MEKEAIIRERLELENEKSLSEKEITKLLAEFNKMGLHDITVRPKSVFNFFRKSEKKISIAAQIEFKKWVATRPSNKSLIAIISKINAQSLPYAAEILTEIIEPDIINNLLLILLKDEFIKAKTSNKETLLRGDPITICLLQAKTKPYMKTFFEKHIKSPLLELNNLIEVKEESKNIIDYEDELTVHQLNQILISYLKNIISASTLPLPVKNNMRLIYKSLIETEYSSTIMYEAITYYFTRFIVKTTIDNLPLINNNLVQHLSTILKVLTSPLEQLRQQMIENQINTKQHGNSEISKGLNWEKQYKQTIKNYFPFILSLEKIWQEPIEPEYNPTFKPIYIRASSSPSFKDIIKKFDENIKTPPPTPVGRSRSGTLFQDSDFHVNEFVLKNYNDYTEEECLIYLKKFTPLLVETENLVYLDAMFKKIKLTSYDDNEFCLIMDKNIEELTATISFHKNLTGQEKNLRLICILNPERFFDFCKTSFSKLAHGSQKQLIELNHLAQTIFQDYYADYIARLEHEFQSYKATIKPLQIDIKSSIDSEMSEATTTSESSLNNSM